MHVMTRSTVKVSVCTVSATVLAVLVAVVAASPVQFQANEGPVTFTSYLHPQARLRHCNFELYGCAQSTEPAQDFQWSVVDALNGVQGAVSLQSANFPDHYVSIITTEEEGRLGIVAQPDKNDASFMPVTGLANASHLSFKSLSSGSFGGAYITLSDTLRGDCSSQYSSPSGDAILVENPNPAAATWVKTTPPPPPPALIVVNTTNVTHTINPLFLGCHSDSGYVHQVKGFYSQMIFGESFESNLPENSQWISLTQGQASGTCSMDPNDPFHGMSSQRVEFDSGNGAVGVVNRGLGNEGLVFKANKPYEGYFFAKSPSPVTLVVQLQDKTKQNAVIASQKIQFQGGNWTQLNFTLTPTIDTNCVDGSNDSSVSCGKMGPSSHICVSCAGQFFIGLAAKGTVNIDFVFLQPGSWARLNELPVLKSTIDTLQTMGIRAIRQGGSYTDPDYYFWKNWRGKPWERPSVGSVWGDELIGGWGPFEMIDMCAAAGIEPIITTTGQTKTCCSPSDMADLVEYCYGNESTTWGKQRIQDGHPEPYGVRFFELGNEQYNSLYPQQVAAMEERATELGIPKKLFYMSPNNNWLKPDDAKAVEALGLRDHVVADLHNGGTGAVEESDSLFKSNSQYTFGTVNAETNAGTHHMARAIQEASDLNDFFSCSAPWCSRIHFRTASFCTERSGHYDNFDQGISFFLPNMTWIQPPGYVHQMTNETWQPHGVQVTTNVSQSFDGFTVSAQISDDRTAVVCRLTNAKPEPGRVQFQFVGSFDLQNVHASVLSANASDGANPPSQPAAISPTSSKIDVSSGYTIEGYSVAMLTFTAK